MGMIGPGFGYQPRESSARPVLPPPRFPSGEDVVAAELTALRKKIEALRKTLTPPKSVVITGPEVDRVFTAITSKGGTP